YALKRVCDQVPRPLPRICLRFLLELADTAGQFVPDELLGTRQDLRLGLPDREAGDPLELGDLAVLGLLALLLELLDVSLAIGDALLPAFELEQAAVEVVLARVEPLALAEDVAPLALELALDLGAVLDGSFLGFQLGFPAQGLR